MKIEPNKFFRTRDGSKARIYAVGGSSQFPIHGAIFYGNDKEWTIVSWTSKGKEFGCMQCSGKDLITEWKDEPLSVTFECEWGDYGGLTHPLGYDASKQLEQFRGKKTTVTVVEKQGE